MLSCSALQTVDPHTVDVDGKLYTTKNILISVGGRPFIPEIPGSEYVIDSDAALDLPSRPKKIAIVGGGYIAVEFAGIFNGLKSEVHVFISQKKILRGFDEEIRDFVAEQMSLRGIEFHTEESPQAVFKSSDGTLALKTTKGTAEGFSHIMFATGRKPNTKFMQAQETALRLDLDGLVVIGGDDSNTNACLLAEKFRSKNLKTRVIGCPKTIDGDLKCKEVPTSFGFDTACKEDCFYDLPYNIGYQIFVLCLRKIRNEIMKCTLSIYVDIYFD